MPDRKGLADWMTERGIGIDALLEASALERKVVEAILHGQYTPSPVQRRRLAAALGIDIEQIAWGHTVEVQHLYGHGPQFGRTP
jgi:ribosome-binding protein aMBF1 (putative translation factor)